MKALRFIFANSLFLIFGAIAGLIWANLDAEGYGHMLHLEILSNDWIGYAHGGHKVINLHYLVNDILMAFFFAIAGKEVWEATLPGGPLNNPRQAATPLLAALGGMAGPVVIYLIGAAVIGQYDQLSNGWAVPTATDIAFGYLVARFIFGVNHPAVPFLLLLAITDDALGLIILAVFYPSGELQLMWLLLPVVAIVFGLVLKGRKVHSFWPYLLIGGTISWVGFALAGVHPALGLLPIIPTLPNAASQNEAVSGGHQHDTLNAFEHFFKNPVEVILGLFGLMNAGVVFSAIGAPTYLVLVALIVGKTAGIFLFGWLAARVLQFGLPEGMNLKDLLVIGATAGIGFTVALFVASVAFPPGAVQDAAKMGALLSFAAALLAIGLSKVVGVNKLGAKGS